MAIYEYYCPTCRERFEERRPMSQVAVAATCAKGHGAEKIISAFAVAKTSEATMFDTEIGGGGCCGGAGGCACSN